MIGDFNVGKLTTFILLMDGWSSKLPKILGRKDGATR
jgi:hypothetical protein